MPYSVEVGMLWEEVFKRIQKRLRINRKTFAKLGLERFYIAGGALLAPEPNDYDLFPVGKGDFDKIFLWDENIENILMWNTPNAITIDKDGIKIQLCKFWNESLIKTVERFDFTHCKIGATVERIKGKTEPVFKVIDVYISEDFIRSRILGYSEYTGVHENDYPLSSLLRVFKYISKGYIRSSYDVVFKILEALLERGWKDEADFEKQLRGIDIGLDEAEQLTTNAEALKHIYYLVTGRTIINDDIFTTRSDLIGEKLE